MGAGDATSLVSQFGGLQGYLVLLAIVLVPLGTPFAVAAAKRFLGPKSEDVATEAAAKAQQQASTLNIELSAALSASLKRESDLRAENDTLRKAASGGPPDPTP